MIDWPGQPNSLTFGSAHLIGFGMAFCDGSVKTMNYSIDPTIHAYWAAGTTAKCSTRRSTRVESGKWRANGGEGKMREGLESP